MLKFMFLMALSFTAAAVDIQLEWDAPTEREDGTQIESIDKYMLYHTVDGGGQTVVEIDHTLDTFLLLDVAEGAHAFQLSTVENGVEGAKSDVALVSVLPPVVIVISKPKSATVTIKLVE